MYMYMCQTTLGLKQSEKNVNWLHVHVYTSTLYIFVHV